MKATRRELRNAVRNSRHVLEVLGPRAEAGTLTDREKLLVRVSQELLDLYDDDGRQKKEVVLEVETTRRKVNAWQK